MTDIETGTDLEISVIRSSPQATAMIRALQIAVKDPAVPVEKVRELYELRKLVLADEAQRMFQEAHVRCQAVLPRVFRASTGDKSIKYANLEDIDRLTHDPIIRHGFAETYGQAESSKPEHYRVTCTLMHTAGHSKEYWLDAPIVTKGAQGKDVMTPMHAMGSAMTYARRNLKCLIWNIILTNDDDGKKAGQVERGAHYVTSEMLQHIREELLAADMAEDSFCLVSRIDRLEDMLEGSYGLAISRLRKRAAAMKDTTK